MEGVIFLAESHHYFFRFVIVDNHVVIVSLNLQLLEIKLRIIRRLVLVLNAKRFC